MLSAEFAILLHFKTVRIVLLVLHGVVVSLLALRASQGDFYTHLRHLLKFIASLHSARLSDLDAAAKLLRRRFPGPKKDAKK